ncbi:MAG: hypothetical protein NXI01_00610 [Gammaproteobacteria bacterium]|nr:hypothetical protein [Gammaproteobacteria bacterium]
MIIFRILLLSYLFFAETTYALMPNNCGVIYINNNSERTLEVNGIYPDTKEVLKTVMIKPNTLQQSITLGTMQSCAGNTSKIHCNAIWVACHKTVNLIVKTSDTGTILLSGLVAANDSLSFNTPVNSDKSSDVLINDIPQD